MPSGKVHDRITMVTALLSCPVWYLASPVRDLSSFAAGMAAYIFSGFYLSGDLDTKSVSLKRWGPFKGIWYVYQRLVPHRSWVSHGFGIGPIVRVAYFVAIVWIIARSLLWLINTWLIPVDRTAVLQAAAIWLAILIWHHALWAEWALGGLILGGVAHTLADMVVSGLKRIW